MIKSYDTIAQSGYLRFSRESVSQTKEITKNIICDLDKNGQLIGIEMIDCIPADLERMTMTIDSQAIAV
jgi:uncharacterized protein YuzE